MMTLFTLKIKTAHQLGGNDIVSQEHSHHLDSASWQIRTSWLRQTSFRKVSHQQQVFPPQFQEKPVSSLGEIREFATFPPRERQQLRHKARLRAAHQRQHTFVSSLLEAKQQVLVRRPPFRSIPKKSWSRGQVPAWSVFVGSSLWFSFA